MYTKSLGSAIENGRGGDSERIGEENQSMHGKKATGAPPRAPYQGGRGGVRRFQLIGYGMRWIKY